MMELNHIYLLSGEVTYQDQVSLTYDILSDTSWREKRKIHGYIEPKWQDYTLFLNHKHNFFVSLGTRQM